MLIFSRLFIIWGAVLIASWESQHRTRMWVLEALAGPVPRRECPGVRIDHSRPPRVTILSLHHNLQAFTQFMCPPTQRLFTAGRLHTAEPPFGDPLRNMGYTPESNLAPTCQVNSGSCKRWTHPYTLRTA